MYNIAETGEKQVENALGEQESNQAQPDDIEPAPGEKTDQTADKSGDRQKYVHPIKNSFLKVSLS
jgi:hypothetical protein